MSFQPLLHIELHFFVPALALLIVKKERLRTYLILVAAMVVDLDHLWANPIYDPARCSIGFHPLHSYFILPFYGMLCALPKTRWIGLGLLIHMALDFTDCTVMSAASKPVEEILGKYLNYAFPTLLKISLQ